MNNPSIIWLWLITYLLRESTEITPSAGRMSRTDVPQRELRGLTPRNTTQHYASESVTAFQTEGHQLTTCLQIRRSLEGHVVWPEGIRNSSLSYSQAWTVIVILKKHRKESLNKRDSDYQKHRSFLGRPQTGARSDQLFLFIGLPARGLTDCCPLISQQHQLPSPFGL